MTRDEAITYQDTTWAGYNLTDIAVRLRMSVQGRADVALPDDVVNGTVEMLQTRLNYWKPTFGGDGRFDMLVKHLLECALEDVQKSMAA